MVDWLPTPIVRNNEIPLQFHCSDMAEKGDPETKQFSITLPLDAVEMIENGLIPFGLYGKRLATISAALILDMLKTPAVRGQIREGREKAARQGTAESA
jgi:hypothetical protein